MPSPSRPKASVEHDLNNGHGDVHCEKERHGDACEVNKNNEIEHGDAQSGENNRLKVWRANGGARFDLSKFMQRKLLGFVLRRVHEAQDFLAILRAETQKVPSSGRASKENRDYWLRINNAMLPWIEILGHIARHSQLNKFSREGCSRRKANFVGGSYTLYARVNLRSRDMYVGQTENFPVRFAQHLDGTLKHDVACPNQCKRCVDHKRYSRPNGIFPHEWIMIPIGTSDTRGEILKMERWAIRKWRPNLNGSETPFWLKKAGYWLDAKMRVKRPARKFDEPTREKLRIAKDNMVTSDTQPFTFYMDQNGRKVRDLVILLSWGAENNCAMAIKVIPGKYDLTRWKRIVERYGESYFYEGNKKGTLKS